MSRKAGSGWFAGAGKSRHKRAYQCNFFDQVAGHVAHEVGKAGGTDADQTSRRHRWQPPVQNNNPAPRARTRWG